MGAAETPRVRHGVVFGVRFRLHSTLMTDRCAHGVASCSFPLCEASERGLGVESSYAEGIGACR